MWEKHEGMLMCQRSSGSAHCSTRMRFVLAVDTCLFAWNGLSVIPGLPGVCVWVWVSVGGVTLWLVGMHLNSDPVLFKGRGVFLCVMVVVDYRNLSVRCLTVVLHWLALCPTPHTKAASWRAVVCNHDNKALHRGQWGNRGLVNIFMIRKTEIKFHVRGCGCCIIVAGGERIFSHVHSCVCEEYDRFGVKL